MITFNSLSLPIPALDVRTEEAWLRRVAAQHERRLGEINYIFCNDEEILATNRQYLQHDYYTDIITFDSCEADTVNGDLLISLDTVRSNARALDLRYEDELHRVIIHGILHLCGLKDKSKKDEAQMRAAEEEALVMLRETIGSELSLLHT